MLQGTHHIHKDGHNEGCQPINDEVQRGGDCIGDVGMHGLVQNEFPHQDLFCNRLDVSKDPQIAFPTSSK